MMRTLLFLLLSITVAQAAELKTPTTFEVVGKDHGDRAFTATVRVTPTASGVTVERIVRRGGIQVVQRGRGTQEAFRVRSSLETFGGTTGALTGTTSEPLTLVLEHDGQGRCRTRTFAGSELRSLARGQTDGVTTSTNVAIISDLNGSYGSTRYGTPVRNAVRALTDRYRPDVVLITGDMVAGQLKGWGSSSNHSRLRSTCRAMWRSFHSTVTEPLLGAGIPVAPAPGNHDASFWRRDERTIYATAWEDKLDVELVDGTHYPFRYSFVRRGVFFLAIDATRAGRLDHLEWIAEQLGSPRAQACPVRIAYGHFPLHPTAERRRTAILHGSVEEVFAEHDLTLYAAGHHHAYYPGASGGVRQVVMACLGGGPRPLIGRSSRSPRGIVILQIRQGKIAALEAFGGSSFTNLIKRSSLPSRLGAMTRDDRAGFPSNWTPLAPSGP